MYECVVADRVLNEDMVLLTTKVVPLSWYNTLAVIKQQVAKVIFP